MRKIVGNLENCGKCGKYGKLRKIVENKYKVFLSEITIYMTKNVENSK